MPLPLIPLIAAGASLAGQGINAISQGSMNKKTRKWNEKQYARQRADNLADYQMQNAYNDPREQMARLKNAGLNPNLVYGNGATTESAPMRSADTPSWHPEAPQFDVGGAAGAGIRTFYDMQLNQGNIDNLKEQNKVLKQEALLKAAQTIGTLASTDKTKMDTAHSNFDLAMKNTLADTEVDIKKAGLTKLQADTKYTLDENERKAAMQAPTLQEAAERILTLRLNRAKTNDERKEIQARIKNIKMDTKLKEYEAELNKQGLTKGDKAWYRALHQLLKGGIDTGLGDGPADVLLKRIQKK